MKNAEIVKRGEIRSRKFYVVRRNVSGSFESIMYSHIFGDEFGRDFFCGYLDVTGSRFDGKDDADLEGMTPCEITYGGRGVPGVEDKEASEHPGWFLGFDTAHAGMGDEDAESVFQTLVLLSDAIPDNAEAKEGAHEESENAAIDAANISGAVRMEAEMARKEAGTLDDLVASLRQRSRDAIAAGMRRYSDALDVFADNIEAAINIDRAGVSAMRDALRGAHRTLRLVVENAADVLQPRLCEEVVHTGKAVEAALSAAGGETEGDGK